MPQGEVMQEIRNKEVLHLAGQRHGLVSSPSGLAMLGIFS